MVEELRKAPVENMDEVMYFVNGTYRLLEFVVALFVVAYGVCETLFGQWSVMGSTIILLHAYYNVWLRAQLGWQSFLLRRDAVHKIQSLPTASALQLQQYNDICAICYQVSVCMCIYARICQWHHFLVISTHMLIHCTICHNIKCLCCLTRLRD